MCQLLIFIYIKIIWKKMKKKINYLYNTENDEYRIPNKFISKYKKNRKYRNYYLIIKLLIIILLILSIILIIILNIFKRINIPNFLYFNIPHFQKIISFLVKFIKVIKSWKYYNFS